MAKKRRSRQPKSPARSHHVIARPLRVLKRPVALSTKPYVGYDAYAGKTPLTAYQDRRLYNPWPAALRPAFSLPRSAARIVVKKVAPKAAVPWGIKFAQPRRVLICLRRHARREVLLALGKGGGGKRRPKRNNFSGVSC